MQANFFENRPPLTVVKSVHPVLMIVPAEMIATYVPYQDGLDMESAALIAFELDQQASMTLEQDVKDA